MSVKSSIVLLVSLISQYALCDDITKWKLASNAILTFNNINQDHHLTNPLPTIPKVNLTGIPTLQVYQVALEELHPSPVLYATCCRPS